MALIGLKTRVLNYWLPFDAPTSRSGPLSYVGHTGILELLLCSGKIAPGDYGIFGPQNRGRKRKEAGSCDPASLVPLEVENVTEQGFG